MKSLGSLTQKRRPKLCDHISEGLAWLGSNSRERRRQECQQLKHRRMDCSER